MKLFNPTAEVFIPGPLAPSEALARTTHLCVAAHQDDIEIMAAQPIIDCFQHADCGFTGVVLTDGRGSPRDGAYSQTTNEDMRRIRMQEQRKAAIVGDYAALVLLDYPSESVKNVEKSGPVADICEILRASRPQFLYTHNLADKHDTHVAVALRVIQAVRLLDPAERPQKLIGCEVWRSLDWLNDPDKVLMDLSTHENLQHALLGVFDSQITGGKRYDLAAISRRHANATFFESHGVDVMTGVSFAMDLTPLVNDPTIQPFDHVREYIRHFETEVMDRIATMS